MTENASSPLKLSNHADGNLLVLLISGLYVLFTFVSSTQNIIWPWVVLWQAVLILPMVWLLWQLWHKRLSRFRLGQGFDWLAGLVLLGVALSTAIAPFAQPAIWYSIGALSGLALLYSLVGWLTPARAHWLLVNQGYLAIAFILVSLVRWGWQIYRPEMQRLAALRAYGLAVEFDASALGLRNWYPLGHQNYVAGYLLLMGPLLVGLAISDKTWRRWLWVIGLGLALIDLYTTNSRGATLGFLALLIPAILSILILSRWPRRLWLPVSSVSLALAGIFVLTNVRLRESIAAISRGSFAGGGVVYRAITNVIGWHMGQQRPWAGEGLGSVLVVFQKYRPHWAGQEAELHYQLHSTPAQLWGELGLWGVGLPLAGAALLLLALGRRSSAPDQERLPSSLRWSLVAAFWGYGVFGLTDYQLDVIPISGVLLIFTAILLADLRSPAPLPTETSPPRWQKGSVLAGVGLVVALVIWLVPLHRAWAVSAQGFVELSKNNLPGFVTELQRASNLSAGDAYYPFMLGWVLGDLSYQVENPEIATALKADAIPWLQRGNRVSPYQEFGHSNLAWLELPENPPAAIAEFAQSATLVPAKQGVFFGLGYSLYLEGQRELAVEAIALEILRNPLVITHRALNEGVLSDLLPAIRDRVDSLVDELLAAPDATRTTGLLRQIRGTLHWWTDDLASAAADWAVSQEPTSLAVLATAQNEPVALEDLPDSPGKFALQAWRSPEQRRQWLETAWLAYEEDLPQLALAEAPAQQISALVNTMNAADSFDQWLKATAPYIRLRNERLGFGVLMRHDDGPSPTDYYLRLENLAMTRFFEVMLPSPPYFAPLDRQLQPYREALLAEL
ncbi:MAG: O-antigen ligase family protein [Leptolyngbyaceae cyanobacterium]